MQTLGNVLTAAGLVGCAYYVVELWLRERFGR